MRLSTRFAMAALVAVSTLVSTNSYAQTQRVSVDELTEASSLIIQGEATNIRSYWQADRRFILTEITVQVTDALKGDASGTQVITIPGGRIGDTAYEVSDMPVFAQGEEVLLFISQDPSGRQLVVGGSQGKLTIETEVETGMRMVKGVPGLLKDERRTPDAAIESSSLNRLDTLKERIKALTK